MYTSKPGETVVLSMDVVWRERGVVSLNGWARVCCLGFVRPDPSRHRFVRMESLVDGRNTGSHVIF